ncbi:MAG: carbohydrate binding family 9 domain-containing protein [Steroidobacteraceae bacterium]
MPITSTRRAQHAVTLTTLLLLPQLGYTQAGNSATTSIATATAITRAEQPIIDGDVSDAIWERAEVISTFYQIEPQAFAAPSETTLVRLLYDNETLYVSIYCRDSEPDKITATVKSRDGVMPRDDFVRIMLDPQMSRRDGYVFEISPLGGRTDGLLQNNSTILTNWNAIWSGQSRRVADGWTAEMAIPFRAVSFDPNQDRWGFDIVRQIKRKSETIRFAPTDSSVVLNDISLAGTLTGLQGLSQGAGLDVQLYGLGRYVHDWPTHSSVRKGDASATAYYKFTPALTGTLTYNPDFSDTPLDTRRVNTTRFSLFDAETREFFLQDASAFEFGGRGFSISNNGQPFFSRNIGLVNGSPVAVDFGGKLSGELGPLRMGLLSARTEDTGAVEAQTLSVARLSTAVLDESSLGMIVTHGDPTGRSTNTVAGVDFQYRNSDIGSGKRLLTDFYFERSYSDIRDDDNTFGVAVVYPNEPWFFDFYAKQIGADFMPALGFVNRTGVREYNNKITRRTRLNDAPIRWYEFSVISDATTNLNDRLLSRRNNLSSSLQNNSGDSFTLNLFNKYEYLDTAFTVPGGIVVPAGSHSWSNFNPRIETSAARPVFASWSFECCSFYDGRYLGNELQITYRPSGTYDLSLRHVINHIERELQSVDIQIGSFELGVQFTPDMQLKMQVQYDNISQRFRSLIRYKWEPWPGSEVFAAVGEDAVASSPLLDSRYYSQRTDALLRLGHRLQF